MRFFLDPINCLFPTGRIMVTPVALDLLAHHGVVAFSLILRHQAGDWGDALCAEDVARNDEALRSGGRLVSSYCVGTDTVVWVITEADRSATTILRPDDY
ncbi:hypothetical protein [Stutzerimonas kunmingensis]|uniref:hypothetical protein n=1 Tax=Stutzerimonas kunmingensis TaxID=1211807 RepID=UPI00241D6E5B|nr:hypothetical protein [Stutzerimonas kunmingensis]